MFETPLYKVGEPVYIIDYESLSGNAKIIGTTIKCIQVPKEGKVKYCTEYGTYHEFYDLYPSFQAACFVARKMYEKHN